MLLTLPNELLLEIVENFTETTDVFYLFMTCKHFSHLLQPILDNVSAEITEFAAASNLPMIHFAAWYNQRTTAKLALKRDPASLNQYIDPAGTALHIAVFEGYDTMVEFLLNNGADPNTVKPDAEPGAPADFPLHLALANIAEVQVMRKSTLVDEGIVTLLLKHGADPNSVTNNGMNSLLHAARLGLRNIVEAILDTNAVDINSRNLTGNTALHVAVGRKEGGGVPELLIERGIDVNATNRLGQTALFQCHTQSATALLLNSGADTGIVDRTNRTVLHYLAHRTYHSHTELHAKQILKVGGYLNIHIRDINHRTALEIAIERGNHGMRQLLEELI